MNLSGEQYQKLKTALLTVYNNESLSRMLHGKVRGKISKETVPEDLVDLNADVEWNILEVLDWAKEEGLIIEFIEAVRDYKTHEQELKEVCNALIEELKRSKRTKPTPTTSAHEPKPTSEGHLTKALIEKIIITGDPNIGIKDRAPGTADLVVEVKLGKLTTLLRCIDDENNLDDDPAKEEGSDETEEGFLKPYVEHARELIPKSYDAVILLTHRPIDDDNDIPPKVEIVSVAEFVGRYFKLSDRKKSLNDELKDHKLTDKEYIVPIPYTVVTGKERKEEPEGDCFDFLKGLMVSDTAMTCVLLGHFGIGKTSLCLLLANEILEQAERDPSRTAIPIFLRTEHIEYTDSDADYTKSKDTTTQPRVTLNGIRSAIQQQYGYQISDEFIENFFEKGKLIIFIDSLDEFPMLADSEKAYEFTKTLPHLGRDKAKYVITLRRELFETQQQERDAFRQEGFTKIWLKNLHSETAYDKFQERLQRTPTLAQLSRPGISKHLRELIQTPIFHRIAEEIDVAEEDLTDYDLVKAFVVRWAERETERQKATHYALDKDDRFKYCKLLARAATEEVDWNGKIPHNHLVDVLKRYREKANNTKDVVLGRDRFDRAVRLSMFLVRDENEDTYSFLYPAVQEFFLSQNIGDELLNGNPKVLGAFELKKEMELVPYFLNGYWLEEAKEPFDPEKILRNIAEGGDFIDQSSANSFLIQNLLFLACGLRHAANGSARTEPIRLDGLALPLADLSQMPVPDGELPVLHVGNANMEFVRLPQGEEKERPEWTEAPGILDPVVPEWKCSVGRQDEERLRRYCIENGVVEEHEFVVEEGVVEKGLMSREGPQGEEFRWVLVPGGCVPVGKYKARRERGFKSDLVRGRNARVMLPSFLIQKWPVTNGQFLDFLLHPENEDWDPAEYCRSIGDHDYLAGWTKIFEAEENLRNWLPDEIKRKYNRWKNAPLVYVTWEAAHEFAKFYGLALPTEAEYEVAARLGHIGYEGRVRSLPEAPWGIVEEGYAIYRGIPGLQETLPLYPDWDCTVPNPTSNEVELTPDFAEWSKDKDVPYHMVGGVREWTQDVWSPEWPRGLRWELSKEELYIDTRNTGLRMDPKKEKMKQKKYWGNHRAMRGGSYHLGKDKSRISYRDAHLITNVDPNTGFRCVKRIWPSTDNQTTKIAMTTTADAAARKPRVFISYNHGDSEVANKIKDALRVQGFTVIIDSEAMHAGGDIEDFIVQSIKDSDATLSIVSTRSLLSAWVAMESINTLYSERFGDGQRFIACYIDADFFEDDFSLRAADIIDEELSNINQLIDKHNDRGLGTKHLDRKKDRLLKLRSNLDDILVRLRNSLTLNIQEEHFDESLKRIVRAIKP